MERERQKGDSKDKGAQPTIAKKRILVREGLFVEPSSPSEAPRLLSSRCTACGEVAFPRQPVCPYCQSRAVEEALLGPRGKLYSFTNVNHPVPEGYRGPIPYGVGIIEFPEGARVVSYLTEGNPDRLKAGMDMSLVVEKLFEDSEGNDVIGFKFKPM